MTPKPNANRCPLSRRPRGRFKRPSWRPPLALTVILSCLIVGDSGAQADSNTAKPLTDLRQLEAALVGTVDKTLPAVVFIGPWFPGLSSLKTDSS